MRTGFIEPQKFRKEIEALLDAKAIEALYDHLSLNPQSGEIMAGTGGVRKIRWAATGSGKSGGSRVIYFYHDETVPLLLISAFGKSNKVNLTGGEKAATKKLVKDYVAGYKKRKKK